MRLLALPLLALATALTTAAPTSARATGIVDGHWDGAVTRMGSAQPIAFDVVSDAAGRLRGTYDIPELGLFGEPLSGLRLDGTQLAAHFLYGDAVLTVHPESAQMTGVNPKWKPPIDVHLKRTLAVKTYRPEAVTVQSGNARIAGTLYRPLESGRVPLIVVVPGSDDRGRAAWEYRGYGPMLAQQGIAAFVYDKRNVGASTNGLPKPALRDYAGDVRAIVAALRHRAGINPFRVGLAGASQGGWIAPLAAAGDPHVAFLVLLAGPAVSVERQELDRIDAAMAERNATPEERERARTITQAYFDVGSGRAPLSTLEAQNAWLAEHKPAWADVLSGPDPGESLRDAAADWQRLQYDPAATLHRTRIPALAIFGSDDDLVLPGDNVPLMRTLVGTNNSRNRIVVLDGASHGFFMGQHLEGGDWLWPDKWWVWDRRAPELLPTIVAWVDALPASH